jgi:glycosyltransferase involved in cell wall biosynthesis
MNPLPAEIIHIGVNRWDSMIQREQHLIKGLSQYYRILFIDPPLSFLTIFLERMGGKKRSFRSQFYRVNDRLAVYTPPAFPPFGQKISWVHRWNTQLLVSRMRSLIREHSFENYVLGISWPLWAGILHELNPQWSYYDCSDEYLTYPGLRANRERLRQSEEELLRSVTLVLCSSQRLKEAKSGQSSHCFLIPNGVDLSSLEIRRGAGEIPSDLKAVRKPILGYLGTIGEWLDFDTLGRLARARPDWSIVMIGPLASRRLASLVTGIPNLHWLGEKGHDELPGYLGSFDVCLIPFRVNEFTEKIYPTKLHQYLGMGKPVVSARLPELKSFSPWVMFYDSVEEIEKVIERSLREDSEDKVLERKRIAGENTWDRRVKSIVEIFEAHFT